MDTNDQKKKADQQLDRLTTAIQGKTMKVELDGRKLVLNKWSLREGIKASSKIIDIVKELMPTGNVSDLMKADVGDLLLRHEDDFIEVLTLSVNRGNFDSLEEAGKWIEELSPEDALELFTYVGRLNIRPLMDRLGKLGNVLVDVPEGSGSPALAQR